MIKRFTVALLIALPLLAQEEPPLRPLPVGDVLLSLPSNQIAPIICCQERRLIVWLPELVWLPALAGRLRAALESPPSGGATSVEFTLSSGIENGALDV